MTESKSRPLWRRLRFAAGICLALLVLSFIPQISEAIQAIDYRGALWLNQAVGRSPVFDQILLFIAEEEGQERVLLLFFVWFLLSLWLTKSPHIRAEKIGAFLFILTILVLYFAVDSLVDDVVRRKGPSYTIVPFRDLDEVSNYDADTTEKQSFPSAEAMMFFVWGFTLLRLGRRRSASAALLAGAVLPLGRCVVGTTWLSDIYLGSLPLSLLVSAAAVETPFVRFHRRLIDLSSAALDQSERLFRNFRPKVLGWRNYVASQNVYHMEVAVKRFASNELPYIVFPDLPKIRPISVRLEIPLGGLRSVVRIADVGDKRVILRAYPTSRRAEANQHHEAASLLAKHGIRTPKVLYVTDDPRRYGAIFIVEEFVLGHVVPPDELEERHIQAAAEEIARLHNVQQAMWGPLNAARTESYPNVLLRRADRQLEIVLKGPVLKGQGQTGTRVRRWLESHRPLLDKISSFSLIHDTLHRENCLFEESGRFCFLDNATMVWGYAAADLVHVRQSLCNNDVRLIKMFESYYYPLRSPTEAEHLRQLIPFYTVFYHLSHAAKYTKRLTRARRRTKGDAVAKGRRQWNHILEIVSSETEAPGN